MKAIFTLFVLSCMITIPQWKIDFADGGTGRTWRTLNDGVMGGLSQGTTSTTDEGVTFKGRVSLANNGGFASFRSPFTEMDLSEYTQIRMRVRGKGMAFAFNLETDPRWYLPYFKQGFQLDGEEWQDVILPLDGFKIYQVGRNLGGKVSPADLNEVIRMGVVTNEKREGAFELEIAYIVFE